MAETPKSKNKICFFTKHLQGLSFDEIASLGAEAGYDGVESPIRPKGHIEPEKVVDELPKYVEALKKQNLELMIMTSGINEVSAEQRTEEILRTAAKLRRVQKAASASVRVRGRVAATPIRGLRISLMRARCR